MSAGPEQSAVRTFFRYHLPPLVWAMLIFIGSDAASLGTPPAWLPVGADKAVHFLEYTVLGFLLTRSFHRRNPRKAWLLAAGAAALYGASDEWHQFYVPGRAAEAFDWLADAAGAIGGSLLYTRTAARAPRRS